MNTAIIAAAGSGSRFGSEIPKQFLDLAGRPVILHSLECFQTCDAVDEIIVVLAEDSIGLFEAMQQAGDFPKIARVVPGGASRAESVLRGVEAVSRNTGIVAVHDGARPLVTADEIRLTIEKAAETGAACLVAPVVDTIKEIRDGEIAGTLDRNRLRRALTPQAFRVATLKRAFAQADLTDAVTDECYLVEKLGVPIAIVEGSPRNIKITHPDDLLLAEAYLKGGS